MECTLVHFAAVAATAEAIDELRAHVASMRSAATWADYHAADERFHLGVAHASAQDWAIPRYTEALHGLYQYFLPYPIEYLHGVNDEHAELLDALEAHDAVRAVEITRRHVSVLHETMFVGLDH
jgi:DNA-binding GntR family transcriptional regulator